MDCMKASGPTNAEPVIEVKLSLCLLMSLSITAMKTYGGVDA
jgi:hypothetical protein